MKKSRKDKLMTAAVFAAFGGVMYLKNRMMPKYADDYPYSFIWEGDEHGNLAYGNHRYERVRNLRDLIKSQISHYKTWDGRAIAESLVQIFLIPDDKKVFDRANTVVMLSQLAICSALAKAGTKSSSTATAATIATAAGKAVTAAASASKLPSYKKALTLTAGFWACTPHLAGSCMWLTGSMNYLWVGVLQSAYVLQYSRRFHDPTYHIPSALAAFMGLTAGWTTETGAGAALMLSGMELLYAKAHSKAERWMYAGVIGCIVGMGLLLLAPGVRLKFKIEKEYSDTLPTDLTDRQMGYLPEEYLYTPFMFKTYFIEGFLHTVLRELPLQIPVLIYLFNKECHTPKANLYLLALESAVWAIPSVMMLSPEYPPRSTYPSVIYLLAAAVYALEQTGTEVPPYTDRWFKILMGIGKGALAIKIMASALVDADFYCQFEDQIKELKERGKDEVMSFNPPILPMVYSFIAGDRSIDIDNCMGIGFEKDDPYNSATAAYYGTKEYRVDYSDELERIYKERNKDMKDQLMQPVFAFVRRIKELIHEENEI